MQRTALSTSSTAVTITTGRCAAARDRPSAARAPGTRPSPASRRRAGRRRSPASRTSSRASAPSSAVVTWCPSRSRLRDSISGSRGRRRPRAPSAVRSRLELRTDARQLARDPLELRAMRPTRLAAPSSAPAFAVASELATRRPAGAPNVAAFDFSVCAAPDRSSASSCSSPVGASRAGPGHGRGRCRPAPTDRPVTPPSEATSRRTTSTSTAAFGEVRRDGGHRGQGPGQLLEPDRLREVVVHAGLEAQLALALHRVRRHRDDVRPRSRPPLVDAPGRLEPVHLRHLDVHEHRVVGLALERLQRLDPVGRPRRPGSPPSRAAAGPAAGSRRCPRRRRIRSGGARRAGRRPRRRRRLRAAPRRPRRRPPSSVS